MGARVRVMIEAKPEQVFYVMTDPELSKEWLKGAVETIPLSDVMDQPGARFKQRFLQGKKWSEYEGQVTAFEKDKLFAAEVYWNVISDKSYQLSWTGEYSSLRQHG